MRQFGKVFGKNLANLVSCQAANTNTRGPFHINMFWKCCESSSWLSKVASCAHGAYQSSMLAILRRSRRTFQSKVGQRQWRRTPRLLYVVWLWSALMEYFDVVCCCCWRCGCRSSACISIEQGCFLLERYWGMCLSLPSLSDERDDSLFLWMKTTAVTSTLNPCWDIIEHCKLCIHCKSLSTTVEKYGTSNVGFQADETLI